MEKQSEALRMAEVLMHLPAADVKGHAYQGKAAAELRRLHAVNAQLLEALEKARGALAYVAVGNAKENPNLAQSTCSQAVWKIDRTLRTLDETSR